MRIVLQSPEEADFDPSPAINHWNKCAVRKRRSFQPPYRPRVAEGNDDTFTDSDVGSDSDDGISNG